MDSPQSQSSYFSVSFALISTGIPLPYDLYVNSSSLAERERFVRIFPKGEALAEADLERFRTKYRQLYIPENQRSHYISSVCRSSGKGDAEKATVLKDSAIKHLQTLFDGKATLSAEVLNETIANCKDVVENMVDVLHDYTVDSLQSLIGKLSFHDFYTYDHSINVSMYCVLLYRFYKPDAPRSEVVQAGLGGLLHDIGKIQVPTQIINKPGKLDPDEWEEIKWHPDYGYQMLLDTQIIMPANVDCDCVKKIVFEHHENFDGTGYPNKVAGEKIHLLARITAIADFFDAVTTKRSYSEPLSVSDALSLMEKSKAKKLDPKLFELFASNTKEFAAHKSSRLELTKDFDPCQPQEKRVLVSLGKVTAEKGPEQDIGKVILSDNSKPKRAS